MALPQQVRKSAAVCRRRGNRFFPFQLSRPAADNKKLNTRQASTGDNFVQLPVVLKAFHPVVRPVMRNYAKHLAPAIYAPAEGIEYFWVFAVINNRMWFFGIKPFFRMIMQQPI